MFFDTHTHLDLIEKKIPSQSLERVWQRAQENLVKYACQIGIDLKSSIRAKELASKLEGLFFSIGYHPSNENKPEEMDRIIELAEKEKNNRLFVAIGETGLDYHWIKDEKARKEQMENLLRLKDAALDLDKTLIIHARPGKENDALDDLSNFFQKSRDLPRIILHCFAGDEKYVSLFSQFNCYFSFAGNVTYKNAHALKASLSAVPREKLLIETDAPYLTPVPRRGEINESAFLPLTFDFICNELKENKKELAAILMDNSLNAFNLK